MIESKAPFCLVVIILFVSACSNIAEDQSHRLHDSYYKKACELLDEKVISGIQNNKIQSNAQRDSILLGISYLDSVTKLNPENWAAFWLKGKAYQVLQKHEGAYTQFQRAFILKQSNPDLARELSIEALETGRNREAESIGEAALSLSPADPGLMGNLALIHLINGKLISAEDLIQSALLIRPDDPVNQYLEKLIREVKDGTRPQPKHVNELKN
ncbi:MAG: hypothetical protein MRZ79_15990 [Bacteroidia bacterium]|nr:hypothetical protein [Bacteroidia bacterium]